MPEIALIGVGKDNSFGHPSDGTIERLNKIKCKILRTDENGEEHKPTKESIILALQYLNKPFLENVYNSSVQAAERNAGIPGAKQNAWSTYIRTIAMQQYSGKQFKDSDFFKQKIIYEDEKTPADVIKGKESQDNYEGFDYRIDNNNDIEYLIGKVKEIMSQLNLI